MKRKVKSWEDLLLIGELDDEGGIRDNHENFYFDADMRKYCGREIEPTGNNPRAGYVGNYDGWYFDEWMLEPIATENSLREAVQEVIELLEEPDGVANLNWITNRLKEALND